MRALTDGRSRFIPYRDSRVTRLLRNNLGGNGKLLFCVNCPNNLDTLGKHAYDETMDTLRSLTLTHSIECLCVLLRLVPRL